MATRPFYFVNNNQVREGSASFEWFSGFSVTQKQKSIRAFHEMIRKMDKTPLEVSTKSEDVLGKKLSAFNLKLDGYYLENIFQSSKVFVKGGPYADLLEMPPKDAKRDERLRTSGRLTAFRYNGIDWPLEPKTVFYDWLYYNAVRNTLSGEELDELKSYDAFTDIEFNPEKSLNTQARSAALVVQFLHMFGKLPEMKPEEFVMLHKNIVL